MTLLFDSESDRDSVPGAAMRTSIHVDADSVEERVAGPATGNVWLTVGGQAFPAHQWNDFIVVVLSWWVVAMVRLLRKASEREVVHFMDGPYAVEVFNLPGGVLRFRALEGARRDRERAVGEESAAGFVAELMARAHEVLDACRQRNSWSPGADKLRNSLEELEECAAPLQPN